MSVSSKSPEIGIISRKNIYTLVTVQSMGCLCIYFLYSGHFIRLVVFLWMNGVWFIEIPHGFNNT